MDLDNVQRYKGIGKCFQYPEGCGYKKVYKHYVPLGRESLNFEAVTWAAEHLKKKWGWYFEQDTQGNCVMTFEDKHEMLMWAMRWQAKHREKTDV